MIDKQRIIELVHDTIAPYKAVITGTREDTGRLLQLLRKREREQVDRNLKAPTNQPLVKKTAPTPQSPVKETA
jgi:hypothetical protein